MKTFVKAFECDLNKMAKMEAEINAYAEENNCEIVNVGISNDETYKTFQPKVRALVVFEKQD